MPPLILFLFLLDIIFIVFLSSIDSFLILLFIFPWTLSIYIMLWVKGFRHTSEDEILKLAGKLYWIAKGTFQASMIAISNVMLSVLIVPDSVFNQFEQQFGIFTPILLLLILPLPGIFILSLKGEEQEQLYELIYQRIIQEGEAPEFILITSELLNSTKRYSEEYYEKMDSLKKSAFTYIEQNFRSISPFFEPKSSFSLNLENLAIFVTQKAILPKENSDILS